MPAITSDNLANAIMKFVAATFLPALSSNLVMGNSVNRSYEDALANQGDQVTATIAPTLVANNLADGGSVQTQNPTPGSVSVTLNSHIEASFKITDLTRALSSPDSMALFMQPSIIAMAEKVETDLLGLYPQFTANTPVGTAGVAPTESVIDQVETALFRAKVPQSLLRTGVVSADAYAAIRQIPRFTETQTTGQGTAIASGILTGQLKGMTIVRSQLIPQTTVGGTTTTHNLFFAKDAIAMVMRRLPPVLPGTGAITEYIEYAGYGFRVTISYDPQTLAQQVTIDCLYGMAALRNQFAVEMYS